MPQYFTMCQLSIPQVGKTHFNCIFKKRGGVISTNWSKGTNCTFKINKY